MTILGLRLRIGRFQIQDGVQAPNPNGTLEYILQLQLVTI